MPNIPTQSELLQRTLRELKVSAKPLGSVPHPAGPMAIRYRVGPKHFIEKEISRATMRKLDLSASVEGIPFAAIKLTLLEMDHAEDAYTFVDTCDSHSQYLYTVAYTLDQSWHIEDHAQGDAYLIVDSIVIDPEYGGDGRMKALLADALPLLCPGPYITMLKAFPLAYEGIEHEGSSDFEARKAKLIDYYRRHLGLTLLPGAPGEDGWMYQCQHPPDRLRRHLS